MFFDDSGGFMQVFGLIPVVGDKINFAIEWPMIRLAEIAGTHIFHLTGFEATHHGGGASDTALNWILIGLFVLTALIGGLIWTAISTWRGNRRTEYVTLHAWLRLLLRLTLAWFMVGYGMSKVFQMQMPPISIAVLNEPLGQTSPHTLLWSLIALHPLYQIICGLVELAGGVLILFRRTALLGTLILAFVMTNVLLYNIFFDVPVKLFAFNLLLALLFLMLPDLPSLFRFFWKHQPSAPVGVWYPPMQRRSLRITARSIEVVYIVAVLLIPPLVFGIGWHREQVGASAPTPLLGAWHLDSTHPARGPFITGNGLPASDFYVDAANRAFRRSTDGTLWHTSIQMDHNADKITIFSGRPTTYAWQMVDANHLTLTTTPPKAPPAKKAEPGAKVQPDARSAAPFVPQVLTFTRTPIPSHYPLLDRGFHWINPWSFDR